MTSIEQKMKEAILGELYPIVDMSGIDQAAVNAANVAMEQAIGFATYCDKNGWYRVGKGIWVSDEYPEINKGRISEIELFDIYLKSQAHDPKG